MHGAGFGEADPGGGFGVEQGEEGVFFRMVGLRWVAGCGSDTSVRFLN